MIKDVKAFQETILGNPFPSKPIVITDQLKQQTIVRLEEELGEFKVATTLNDQADALVDLMYFALGALHQAGVDTQRVWDAVQHANMTKKKGVTKRGDDNDAAKPAEWKAPDHSWLDKAANEPESVLALLA